MITRILFSNRLYDFLLSSDYTILHLPSNPLMYDIIPDADRLDYRMTARHRNNRSPAHEIEIRLEYMTVDEMNNLLATGPLFRLWIELPPTLAKQFIDKFNLTDPLVVCKN